MAFAEDVNDSSAIVVHEASLEEEYHMVVGGDGNAVGSESETDVKTT